MTTEAKRTIPQLRDRLVQIAIDLADFVPAYSREIMQIADETRRRYGGRRARPRAKKLTPELADAIRDLAVRYPDASQQQIATWVKTTSGRVSEALIGKRAEGRK